ncbi:MAG TPA: molybdopterin-dependent oxidoreductase [Xanthobacteraceae bacterium]|nr:molybdopterin-dependent oxidoreductase [Xanthobacteraceae bacterium]
MRKRKQGGAPLLEDFVAGNGLLHRRALLGGGIVFAGAMATGAASTQAAAETIKDPQWSLQPGDVTPALQTPSRFEKSVTRILSNPKGEARTQHARAPLQHLDGTITPNPLHFTILHSGIPDIDPEAHRFVIHGMVREPLEFTVDALLRYPMVTRKHFVECGGNSAGMFSNVPLQATIQQLHGLVSCAEWTGVPLSTILDEAGIDPKAKWMVAEGADSLLVSRSVPLKKGYEDALIALYQNGERLMPGNGYPMRLLLPGFEGNMNTKFLRRIMITDQPAMTFYEERNYSPLLPSGKAYRFYFVNEVKSFITKPSFGMALKEPGY